MIDIKLEELEKILGPYKKRGQHYYFQCCYCKDSHKDNMIYTPSKGLLKCFANDEHSRMLLSKIMGDKNEEKVVTKLAEPEWQPEIKYWYEINLENLFDYVIQANNNLLSNKQYLKYLKKVHNIDKDTVDEFMIGIDFNIDNKGLHIDKEITDAFVFPIFSVDGLVGCELRSTTGKVIRRTKDAPKCAAVFWKPTDAETLYVTEGLKDAYNLFQFLGKEDNYTLICGSNGVSTTLRALEDIELNKFKRIVLLLDNDEAGDEMTKKVLEKYPQIVDCRDMLKPYKDITEYIMSKG